jgi:dTDP-4-dehydrorhamnose 3,5-epimerase
MKVIAADLPGILLIEPDVYRDERGFFLESYQQVKYASQGLPALFVQDNHSRSTQGTLRGLHAQLKRPQGKLVRVVEGKVLDVVVDIRRGSPTYKQWAAFELSADNFRQCYIPPGFAHGFYTLSPAAQMEYKTTDFYDPKDELHLLWNDPDIGVRWPTVDPVLSPKDKAGVRLKEVESSLPVYGGAS